MAAVPDFSLWAYRRVLRVWSAEVLPGLRQAIMTMKDLFSEINESRKTMVSLDALNGTWPDLESKARMHSFNARRDLLISAPSMRRCRLLLYVSCARSDPAKSTSSNLPIVLPLDSRTKI